MALLLAAVIVGLLILLHRAGFLPDFSLSWTLFWTVFLNILLALGVVTVLVKAWSIAVILGHLDSKLLISPSRDPLIDIGSTAALALALYGIWRRWKWAACLVLARLAFTIGVQVFVYHSLHWQLVRNYAGYQNVLADLIGAAMWLLAFNRTWAQFRR
jgi:hypothetical protein